MATQVGDMQTLGWWVTTQSSTGGLAAPVITTNGGVSFSQATVPVSLAGTCANTSTIIYVNGVTTGVTFTPLGTTWSYSGNLQLGANLFMVTASDGAQESPPDRITVTCTAATSELSIEQALTAIITNDASMIALIGVKFYPQEAPQGTAYPFCTYNRISGVHERHMVGESGLEHPRFQIDIFAATTSSMVAIRNTLRLLLDMYTGTVTVGSASKVIQRIFLEDDFSDFLAPQNASETGIRHGILDFTIWGEETTL